MPSISSTLDPKVLPLASQHGEEDWLTNILPEYLTRRSSTDYTRDDTTMKLEKVNLNKQSLRDQARLELKANFPTIYPKGSRLPDVIEKRLSDEVNSFVDGQIARLTEGKWDVETFQEGYKWHGKDAQYVRNRAINSKLIIPLSEQHTAATIDYGVASRKLADLRKQNISEDDDKIINAIKRVDERQARIAVIDRQIEMEKAALLATKPAK